MANPAIVHSASISGGGTSITSKAQALTITAPTAGNTLLIAVTQSSSNSANPPSVTSVADNHGGGSQTWTKLVNDNPASRKIACEIWGVANTANDVTSVTVTIGAGGATVNLNMNLVCIEVSNMPSTLISDHTNHNDNSGSTSIDTSATATTTYDTTFDWAAIAYGSSSTGTFTDSSSQPALSNWNATVAWFANSITSANVGSITYNLTSTSRQALEVKGTVNVGSAAWGACLLSLAAGSQAPSRTVSDTIAGPTDTVTGPVTNPRTPSDTIGGNINKTVLDAVATAAAARAWWPSAAPTGAGTAHGGTLISWWNNPQWDGLNADRPANTNLNGNGYGNVAMTPTTGPVLTSNSAAPATTNQTIVTTTNYQGSTAIALNGSSLIIAKNQSVEINDGTHSWRFQSRFGGSNPVSSVTPVSGTGNPPFNFASGVSVRPVWEIAVLETFRGQNDSPTPTANPGSTPTTTVADGNTPNIGVTYTPSCPQGLGDYTIPPTYHVLIRPAAKMTTNIAPFTAAYNTSNFNLVHDVQTAANPVIDTVTTSVGIQPYSNNAANGGFNNASHDEAVDLRFARYFLGMANLLGETAYVTNYQQIRNTIMSEFNKPWDGTRSSERPMMLDMAGWDPVYVGPTGLTWEAQVLADVRVSYTNNYVTPGVGIWVNTQSNQKNPHPAPGNVALGQSRWDWSCEWAMMMHLAGSRTWTPSLNVTAAEQANWTAAANSTLSLLNNLINLANGPGTSGLPRQSTYVDSNAGTPVFTAATSQSKAADCADGIYHLLRDFQISGNATAKSLAKSALSAVNTYMYDNTNLGWWISCNEDGTGLDNSQKEVGRSAYGVGIYRILNIAEPTGGWGTNLTTWRNLVNTTFYISAAPGWPYRMPGVAVLPAPFVATYTNSGTNTPFTVTENWNTGEAIGIAGNQLLDDTTASVTDTVTFTVTPVPVIRNSPSTRKYRLGLRGMSSKPVS